MHAAFKLQDDGGFSIGSKYHKGWLGPDLTFQDAEHSFHFIRSKENNNWFSYVFLIRLLSSLTPRLVSAKIQLFVRHYVATGMTTPL